jgi:hypothetical protein
MKQYINEAKRMQFLAGIINESQQINELNDAEQDVVDAILGEGINEGKFNPKEILNKLMSIGKKGLLTAAIISSVLSSCNFGPSTDEVIQDALGKAEYGIVDSSDLVVMRDEQTTKWEKALEDLKKDPTSWSYQKAKDEEEKLEKAGAAITRIKYFPESAKADTISTLIVKYLLNKETANAYYRAYESKFAKEYEDQADNIKNEIIKLTDEDYFKEVDTLTKLLNDVFEKNETETIRNAYGGGNDAYITPKDNLKPFHLQGISPSVWAKVGFTPSQFIQKWDSLGGWHML